jgi:O-antigen ligase
VSSGDAAQLAALLGAGGCVLVLAVAWRGAIAAGFLLLGAAEGLLVWSLVPRDDLRLLVDSPARIAALALCGVAVLSLGFVVARYPFVLPVAAVAAAPIRVPVELGDQEAFLLVPLYAVVAIGSVALFARALTGPPPAIPRVLAWPAAAFLVWAAVSLVWSDDLRAGTIALVFFLFPFAALVAVVARSPFAEWQPRAYATTVVVLGLGFAGVGVWQLWSEDLFFARDLEVANAYTSYFRTTSVFADSSLYGRELALGIVVLLAALWAGRLSLPLGVALVAALWTGLYFSYSQSSFVALAVAALALSLVAATGRLRLAIAAGTAALVVGGGIAVGITVAGDDASRYTSGRSELVSGTARVFRDHPLVGVGVGAQPKAVREEGGRREVRRNASHTTPLTVAAELGVVGVAAYLAFLAGSARLLLEAVRRRRTLGLALAAAFLLLFVHSLSYSGFFENPLVWGVIAVAAAAVVPVRRGAEETAPEASDPGPVADLTSA